MREQFWLVTKITLIIAQGVLKQGKLFSFFHLFRSMTQAYGELALQAKAVKGSSLLLFEVTTLPPLPLAALLMELLSDYFLFQQRA